MFNPLPAVAYVADFPIATLPADGTRVQLQDSAGNSAWATLAPVVPGPCVTTAGSPNCWQAVRVYNPNGDVRLYLSAPGVTAPGVGAWVAAAQTLVVPDATVPVGAQLGSTAVTSVTELEVLESEMEQRDAGWAEPNGVGLQSHQYPVVPVSSARGWVYLENHASVPGNARRLVDQAVFSRRPPSSTMTNMVLSAATGVVDVTYTSRQAHWMSLSRGRANQTVLAGPMWVDSGARPPAVNSCVVNGSMTPCPGMERHRHAGPHQ